MKIAFVASEVVPFAKTGGLADVAGSLPKEIKEFGHDIKVFMPKYFSVDEKRFGLEYISWIGSIPIRVSGRSLEVHFHKGYLPNSRVEIYFIDYPRFFHRHTIYTNDIDEDERFILFSKSVIELIQKLKWKPDIMHLNDWQTGLVPLLIKDNYSWDKMFNRTATVFTIHNIGYQGSFPKETLYKAEINPRFFESPGQIEHEGKLNFLKAGISFADIITTVSETYARELLLPEYSFGMHHVLNYRSKDFYGILNGIDYNIWNPETDKHIPHNYSIKDLSGKLEDKKELLKHFRLAFDENIPVIAVISRLAVQKGFDILLSSMEYLMSLNFQLVLLGSGEYEYESAFNALANEYSHKFGIYVGYNNDLSHLIEAGADMFLMPSHYEPCGLNQIYSLRYGTVPIVRKTGGLADTVKDWDEMTALGEDTGNGYSFADYNGYALTNAVERSIRDFHNKPVWKKIQANGMSEDFSWRRSAEKYINLYKKAAKK
ncbi:Glycogen synthase, ADP-glucose transglucosylase [hydrothermal vent metagenome]|uniref:starch synthase n=1 Tax=hydrothermal vent metagenome TaxID=652676 RepID=A0A3B1BUJ7_9ZZZZ